MSLRQFVNERLTAAAEEIFGVFQKTIFDYEEEIQRQRRLLDIVLNPDVKLHRIELSQQPVCKEEELLADQQQLCVQERSSSLDQEDPEPPQTTELQDELCISEKGEPLVLKQETDAFMFIPTYEESDHSEDQTLNFSADDRQRVTAEKPLGNLSVSSFVVSEPHGDQQLLFLNSYEAERQNQEGGKYGDSGSTNAEPEEQNPHHTNSNINNVSNPTMSLFHWNTQTVKKSFKCDTCEKAFKCKSYLQRHLLVHKCTKPHTCKTCGKSFQYNSYLKVHMRVHTGEKPYTCNTCGRGFRCSSDMKSHMRTHTGDKPYLCNVCGRRPRTMSAFKSHMRNHTDERPYLHQTCGRKFRSISGLQNHMRTHTELSQQPVCKEEELLADQQQLCVQGRSSSLDQEDPEPPQTTELQDELCTSEEGEPLVLKQETDAFMFIPTYEESDHSEDQTLNFSADDRQRVTAEKPLGNLSVSSFVVSEPHGDQQLLFLNSYEAERQNQEGGKYGDSGSTKAEPEEQNPHHTNSNINNVSNPTMSLFHWNTQTVKKSFKCDTCEKAFKSKSNLQRHLLVHKCTKPHTCKTCGKSFQYNSYLKVHMRVHTGEKPYTCNTCGRGFRCSTEIKNHMRTHTGERPYLCQACGKRFCDNSALKSHIRIHTDEKPFTCKICERAFRVSSHLKVHMRTHTGERPYTCKTCGKDFRCSSNLKGHMRQHTGEKLYRCSTNISVK